jgi:CDP-diglyceride synthetase
MTTRSATLKTLAMTAIVATGFINLGLAGAAFGAAPYVRALSVAGAFLALVAALGIYRDQAGWGWLLALLVVAGNLLGYLAGRTAGFPGASASSGADLGPLGVASLVCEGAFVVLFALGRRRPPQDILTGGGIFRRGTRGRA